MPQPVIKPAHRQDPRPTSSLAQFVIGAVGAAAVLSAGIVVYGPFADLCLLQLAAGPKALAPPASQPAASVLADTAAPPARIAAVRHTPAHTLAE